MLSRCTTLLYSAFMRASCSDLALQSLAKAFFVPSGCLCKLASLPKGSGSGHRHCVCFSSAALVGRTAQLSTGRWMHGWMHAWMHGCMQGMNGQNLVCTAGSWLDQEWKATQVDALQQGAAQCHTLSRKVQKATSLHMVIQSKQCKRATSMQMVIQSKQCKKATQCLSNRSSARRHQWVPFSHAQRNAAQCHMLNATVQKAPPCTWSLNQSRAKLHQRVPFSLETVQCHVLNATCSMPHAYCNSPFN
eukprot:scaffold59964_cov22-Tisochrysis_lutea.AAC.2